MPSPAWRSTRQYSLSHRQLPIKTINSRQGRTKAPRIEVGPILDNSHTSGRLVVTRIHRRDRRGTDPFVADYRSHRDSLSTPYWAKRSNRQIAPAASRADCERARCDLNARPLRASAHYSYLRGNRRLGLWESAALSVFRSNIDLRYGPNSRPRVGRYNGCPRFRLIARFSIRELEELHRILRG